MISIIRIKDASGWAMFTYGALAPSRFIGVGTRELTGALATGFAIRQENRK